MAKSHALKSPKAQRASDCQRLEQLPNIGPSLAADLRSIGIHEPAQLAGADAFALYLALCRHSGKRQDPCVLDTFMAATDFMRGAAPAPWWHYTALRKRRHGQLDAPLPGANGHARPRAAAAATASPG